MRRLNWFGFWTLLGLVSGVQLFFADQRLALHPNAWWQALATTLPAWYLWGLLSLVVAWLGRRFRVDRANFGRHFFIHLGARSEEHTSELQSPCNLVCRLLLEKKKHLVGLRGDRSV